MNRKSGQTVLRLTADQRYYLPKCQDYDPKDRREAARLLDRWRTRQTAACRCSLTVKKKEGDYNIHCDPKKAIPTDISAHKVFIDILLISHRDSHEEGLNQSEMYQSADKKNSTCFDFDNCQTARVSFKKQVNSSSQSKVGPIKERIQGHRTILVS